MFQNINETGKTKDEMATPKNIFANIISRKYIILYIITFMISRVTMGYNSSPFAIAIIGACIANEIPIIAVLGISAVSNGLISGASGTLTYIITLLIFFTSFFVKEPSYNDSSRNEKIMLAKRIFFSSFASCIIKLVFNEFLIYDLLLTISYSIISVIFYKIFANSISVLINYNEKMAFSIEEVIGTSLLLSIALCAFGNISILGFSVRNVLSIFIVLVLGWKNGILIRNNCWSNYWSNSWNYCRI